MAEAQLQVFAYQSETAEWAEVTPAFQALQARLAALRQEIREEPEGVRRTLRRTVEQPWEEERLAAG